MSAIASLISISRRIGMKSPFWVQGAGGNVSVKSDDLSTRKVWIKASGTRLDEMSEKSGLACVDLGKIHSPLQLLDHTTKDPQRLEEMETQYESLIKTAALNGESLGRPSMETGFHVLLNRRWVLHFHSVAAVLMSHIHKTKKMGLETLFQKHGFDVQFVPPYRPGLVLSKELARLPEADAYILESHGLILQHASTEILDRWERVESEFFEDHFGADSRVYARVPLEKLLTLLPDPLRGPLKMFFPDSAVYQKEMRSLLTQLPDGEYHLTRTQIQTYSEKRSRYKKEFGLCEIWVATQLLYKLCPDLEELPDDIIDTVASLPTEKFRRGEIK